MDSSWIGNWYLTTRHLCCKDMGFSLGSCFALGFLSRDWVLCTAASEGPNLTNSRADFARPDQWWQKWLHKTRLEWAAAELVELDHVATSLKQDLVVWASLAWSRQAEGINPLMPTWPPLSLFWIRQWDFRGVGIVLWIRTPLPQKARQLIIGIGTSTIHSKHCFSSVIYFYVEVLLVSVLCPVHLVALCL